MVLAQGEERLDALGHAWAGKAEQDVEARCFGNIRLVRGEDTTAVKGDLTLPGFVWIRLGSLRRRMGRNTSDTPWAQSKLHLMLVLSLAVHVLAYIRNSCAEEITMTLFQAGTVEHGHRNT